MSVFSPLRILRRQGTPYPSKPIAPLEPWLLERNFDIPYPSFLGVRVLLNGEKEFWFWESEIFSSKQSMQQKLIVLNTDDSRSKVVSIDEGLSGYSFPIAKLFIAPDNSVWVVHPTFLNSQVPILGKYDETTNSIVPIEKVSEIKHYLHYQTTVLMNEKTGVFWFLVPYGYIYSYDPVSNSLTRHISLADMHPASATIASDGNLFIYLHKYGSSESEVLDALFLYDPQTEIMKYVTIGLEVDNYSKNLFIDHAGRLWADSFGWREPDGKWYQTIRPPEFVLAAVDGGGDRNYHWAPPDIKFEMPNDILWFSGPGGTYSLDFNRGDWCWVSTSSQLQKDSDGNLWLMVENKIYKLGLSYKQ